MRQVLGQALPMIVGLGVLQLNTFFDGLIASYPSTIGPRIFGIDYPLTEGAMSAISYAQRLYQFPLGVFGIAVATAIFPSLVRQWGTPDRFMDVLQRGLRLVVFIGLPASAGLILVRDQLVGVILEGGAFTAADAKTVSFVLFGYATSVWAYSMVQVLTRAYYATGDTRTPVGVAARVVVLNLLLNVTLIWTPLREAGLAWSTAICAVVQVALLLRRLSATTGPLLDRSVLTSWAKSVVCTVAMLFVVALFTVGLPRPEGWFATLLQLLIAVGVGGAVVALGAMLLSMPELWWALGRQTTAVRK